MFTRPAYWPLFAGIWLIPLIFAVIIYPITGWNLLLSKPAAAVLWFRDDPRFGLDSACASESPAIWRAIERSPHAEDWFRMLTIEAHFPAGRLYGLAGLYAVDRVSFERELQRIPRFHLEDPVPVTGEQAERRVPLGQLLRPAMLDSIVRVLEDSRPKPDC